MIPTNKPRIATGQRDSEQENAVLTRHNFRDMGYVLTESPVSELVQSFVFAEIDKIMGGVILL